MKRSDIAALVVVSSISMIIAYFVADGLFGSGSGTSSEQAVVKTADKITAEVVDPDGSIFNEDAINPTVEVVIGDR